MTTYQFTDAVGTLYRSYPRPGAVQVDAETVAVQNPSPGYFVATVDGRPRKILAVADGDTIHVHFAGRAWRVERVDPTRSSAAGSGSGAGVSQAPMPGVVISLLVAPGASVQQGDPLMVIESMKLQMTIGAPIDGTVADLPLTVGQVFQRGDALVRVQSLQEGSQ